MKQAVIMGSGVMIQIPNLVQIDSFIQKFLGTKLYGYTNSVGIA
jgi:hypothetical protein